MSTRSSGSRVREGRITSAIFLGSTSLRASLERRASWTRPGWTTTSCIQCWIPERGTSGMRFCGDFLVGEGLSRFGKDNLEIRDVLVPLVEGRSRSRPFVGAPVEFPDLVDGMIAVGVDDVGSLVRVPGDVVLDDALRRDRVDVHVRVEAVVEGAHVHVVDVQEQPRIRLLGETGQELPFSERR